MNKVHSHRQQSWRERRSVLAGCLTTTSAIKSLLHPHASLPSSLLSLPPSSLSSLCLLSLLPWLLRSREASERRSSVKSRHSSSRPKVGGRAPSLQTSGHFFLSFFAVYVFLGHPIMYLPILFASVFSFFHVGFFFPFLLFTFFLHFLATSFPACFTFPALHTIPSLSFILAGLFLVPCLYFFQFPRVVFPSFSLSILPFFLYPIFLFPS